MQKPARVFAGRAPVAEPKLDVAAQHQRFGARLADRLEALHEGTRLEIVGFFVKRRGELEQRPGVAGIEIDGPLEMFDRLAALALGEVDAGELEVVLGVMFAEVDELLQQGACLVQLVALTIDGGTLELDLAGVVAGRDRLACGAVGAEAPRIAFRIDASRSDVRSHGKPKQWVF